MKFRKVVMILSIFLLGITTSCKKRSENNNNNDNKNPQQEDDKFIDVDITEMLVLALTNEDIKIAFIIKNGTTEIKFYNKKNLDIETIYQTNNKVNSLNYNGKSLFYITDDALWEYDFSLNETLKISDLPNFAKNLQIINNWFYFEAGSGDFYKINPLTKIIEKIK